MAAIPLIRARYLQAFADAAEQVGVHSTDLVERLRIPPAVATDAEALHPASQLFAFADHAAKASGQLTLGLVAGRTQLEEHGSFGVHVTNSRTLRQALDTFCAEALKEYSRADFRVETRGDLTWFCRERIDGSKSERLQVELYLVELMLQTIRSVAGPEWLPTELWLQANDGPELREADPLNRVDLHFDSPILAIPVPRALLSRSLPRWTREQPEAGGHGCGMAEEPAHDIVGSLRQMIHLYLPTGIPKIQVAAEAAGLSVRSLQRRLAEKRQSYFQIVDEVRLQAALEMLDHPEFPITEIARRVGYSSPAHFTRAFRRWAGVAPSEVRADRQVDGRE